MTEQPPQILERDVETIMGWLAEGHDADDAGGVHLLMATGWHLVGETRALITICGRPYDVVVTPSPPEDV